MPNPYVNKVVVNDTVKLDLTADTVSAAHLESGFTAHDMSGAPITGTLEVPVNQSSKSYSVVSSGSATITPDSGYDGMGQVALSVPEGRVELLMYTEKSMQNHSVKVYAEVSGREGYITNNDFPSAEDWTVYASELVSGTYTPTDTSTTNITNYQYLSFDEPDLLSSNILSGKSILGVNGSYSPVTPKGNKTVTASTSVQTGIDIDGYQTLTVNPTPTETATATPSTSSQTIAPSSGKYLSSVTVNAMPSGTMGTVSASKSISGNTATVTPSISAGTAGYNAHSAASGTAVTVTASEVCNSGTITRTANGSASCIGYSQVTVAIPTYDGSVT